MNPDNVSIDWGSVKFRASSWGSFLTEPVTKAAKEAGELSITCQKELLKIYSMVMYGRKKDVVTKFMDKGKQVEDDSIQLFSKLEGQLYYKNEDRLENEWFMGHPDIFSGDNVENADVIWDIKSSWELDTFMPKLIEGVDRDYEAQLNVYYSLTGAKSGGIAYCLVSAPPNIVESEKKSLLWKMNVATEYAPEYLLAAAELEKMMIFDDIPESHRVIKIPVPRNDELIEKMKAKVPRLREWLAEFHKKHMKQYGSSS